MKRKITTMLLLISVAVFFIIAAAIESNNNLLFAGIGLAVSIIIANVIEIVFNKYSETKNTIIFGIITGIIFPAIFITLGIILNVYTVTITGVAMILGAVVAYGIELATQKLNY